VQAKVMLIFIYLFFQTSFNVDLLEQIINENLTCNFYC